jgi:hypothetical protein
LVERIEPSPRTLERFAKVLGIRLWIRFKPDREAVCALHS